MTPETFAELLFFTRAAVLRDPALANARLAGDFAEWGKLRSNGCLPDKDKDAPPLTFSGLLRVWDSPAAAHDCPDCHAPALFVHGSGCGMLNWHFQGVWQCPFCGRADEIRFNGISEGRERLRPVIHAVRAIRQDIASNPPGLPFGEAVARLRALRDADLLDPAHPLEAESLAAAAAVRPFERGTPISLRADTAARLTNAVRDARIRAELVTPERLAAVRAFLDDVRSRQDAARAAAEAELRSLRAAPGADGPKTRLKRGEITRDDYRAIQARKRELADALRPALLDETRAVALSDFLEKEFGRTLSTDEKRVFAEAVESNL